MVGLLYVALEPSVRRHWPYALVAWNRLLAGRWRDPLVGRDVLVGAIAGSAVALLLEVAILAPGWLGKAPLRPLGTDPSQLNSIRHLAVFFLFSSFAVLAAMTGFCLLFLGRLLARRDSVGVAFLFLFYAFLSFNGSRDVLIESLYAAAVGGILTYVARRFGLLATAVAFFFDTVLETLPLTLDFSAWYAGRVVFGLLVLAAIAVSAFHTSLGGKPMFGRALLEE